MMDSLLLYKILKNRTGAEISASGNPAIMSDTLKNNPMNEMKVFGWSKQETTTGAQLWDEDNAMSGYILADGTVQNVNKTNNEVIGDYQKVSGNNITLSYSVTVPETITSQSLWFAISCYDSEKNFLKRKDFQRNSATGLQKGNITIELVENTEYIRISWRKYADGVLMASEGTEALPYEPYTGGQPSPSPDYPQQIVSAGMKWSTGAQLYDMDTRLNVDGIEYKKNGTSYTVNIVKISGNLLYGAPFQFSKEDVDATLSVSQFFNLERANVRISLLDSESNIVGTLWADKAEKELSAKCSKIRFDWSKGGKFIVSDLMLNFGNTALPYEPYTDGVPKLYGDKVNVEVCGKKWLHITPFSTKFRDGVTFEYVKPGGIKVTGTATANVDSPVFPIELEPGDYYADKTIANPVAVVERNGKAIWINGKVFAILQDDVPKYWYFSILQGDTVNATIYPRICKKEEVPQSLSISTPTGLPAIPVDSDGNYTDANGQQWISDYVDLKRGKYVQNICDLPLKDISLEWNTWGVNVNVSNSTGFFAYVKKYAHVGNVKALATICRHHTDAWGGRKVGCSANVNNSYITISLHTSDLDDASDNKKAIESFKKIVKQTDTHVLYVRADPIERDLTSEEIEAYKNLVTYAGTTIVENDAECYMEVSAGGGDNLRAKKLALILGE